MDAEGRSKSSRPKRHYALRQRRANAQWSTVISPQSEDFPQLLTNDDDLERTQSRLLLRENLTDRYNKWACVCLDDEGWPLSYGFSESPDENSSASEDFPVNFALFWDPDDIFEDWFSFWLNLDEKGQDVLYTLLAAAVAMGEPIYYDIEKRHWQPRTSQHSRNCFTLLSSYGPMEEMQIQGTVLDHLARGRSPKDLEKMMENPLYSGFKKRLVKSWCAAFVAGMTNAAAHLAVSDLFEAVFAVLDNSGCSFPPLEVLNITSSVKSDCFKISSSASSSSLTSPKPSGTPETKRRKVDDQAEKKNKVEFWPPTASVTDSQQYGDLSVAVQDGVSGVPKFLVLVEIYSKPWTPSSEAIKQAKAKFTKKLIYVLQCQSEVFGLFFANTNVYMYRAKKEATGKISIADETYDLLQFVSSNNGILHVAEFQRLIIDILTCLASGVNTIVA